MANLKKIEVDEQFAMRVDLLKQEIEQDIAAGKTPLFVMATFGTTSSTAIDPILEIATLCKRYNIWCHVDAAYAGSALILPQFQHYSEAINLVDSFVFNPHKWLFTNFDCTAFYIKDKNALLNSFGLTPEFLRTKEDGQVDNYRDWGIQLGRRFRALKLWFVMRHYGVNGLCDKLNFHLELVRKFVKKIETSQDYELLAPYQFNLICFRYHPPHIEDQTQLNNLNEKLLESLNNTGQVYLTHTKLNNCYTLRVVLGQTNVSEEDINLLWDLLKSHSDQLV